MKMGAFAFLGLVIAWQIFDRVFPPIFAAGMRIVLSGLSFLLNPDRVGPVSYKVQNHLVDHLDLLEAESIQIIREVAAEFRNPVMLYSIGKDSPCMVRLAQKAFFPGKIPFPLLHIDTTYKFREMIEFRDEFVKSIGAKLIVHTNQQAIDDGANPLRIGTQKCCGLLKTRALLDGLAAGGYDAAFGGARRDEEKSRAKERVYSFRDEFGQWDPKNQRPELVERLQFARR